MFQSDGFGKLRISKKAFLIIVGSMLLVALVGWIVLVGGLFKKEKKTKDDIVKEPEYTIPEGYALVFRNTAWYNISDDGEKELHQTYEYDENGREKTITSYEDGEVELYAVYVYDALGRVIKTTQYNGDGSISYESETTYSAKGEITEYRYGKSIDIYDDDGKELFTKTITESGEVIVKTEYRYSADGRLIEVLYADSGTTKLYSYDSDGNLSLIEYYNDGKLTREDYYSVNPNEIETYSYENDHRYLSRKSIMDENGNLTRIYRFEEDGSVSSDQQQEWDSEGRRTKELVYVNGRFNHWYEYEYGDITVYYYGKTPGPTKIINKSEDGAIVYYVEAEYLPGFGLVREQFFHEDGTRGYTGDLEHGEGYWGYYTKTDTYGNPVCVVECYSDREVISKEYQYSPMVIPVECMTDYDRRSNK